MSTSYRTKQREQIAAYLSRHTDGPITAEELWQGLLAAGIEVGQTTVYRTLDKLAGEGCVIKVPAAAGNRASYRYVGTEAVPSCGKMVCLSCGRTIPLECGHLAQLSCHIQSDHQFVLDTRHTVLYGTCGACQKP